MNDYICAICMTTLIGNSLAMDAVRRQIARAATTDASVLILGETGVGKELVARAIHDDGSRYGRPFVPVDCGALPDELAESELFGVRRGAFTGASQDRTGLLESADRGTLFLDEIGNMPARTQAKLLRVLQDRRIRRVGDVVERSIDVRVLSATNSRLDTLRPDLVYRLNTLTITVPPLRQRPADIPLLARHFVDTLNKRYGRRITLGADAVRILRDDYSYPGNVRELEHVVHRAYLQSEREIHAHHLDLPASPVPAEARSSCENFWRDIAVPFSNRLLTRGHVESAVRQGLQHTRGSYRKLVSHFGMPDQDYRRFMDFLRRHQLNVDFRQYREGR